MNKFLSILFVAGMATTVFSQTIWSDNFNSYTLGNLGSQGGWQRYQGSNSLGKVASVDAAYGKSFQFNSTDSNTDGVWFYHEFDSSTRTSGNDIFVTEYDVQPDSNFASLQIYDEGATTIAAEIDFYPSQGVVVYTQDDYENETDGQLIDVDIQANTWYKVKVSYDSNTGDIILTVNGTEYPVVQGQAGVIPGEIDLFGYKANTSVFDNVKISAIETLAVSDVAKKAAISVYPNPATDVVNVKSANKIAEITVYDVSGKVVKTTTETTVNVQNFAKGAYILNIKYADGTKESTKVIKK